MRTIAAAIAIIATGATVSLQSVRAQESGVGIDTASKTVTIGGFTPITGPVPFYSILTHAADAYFRYVNEAGGIDGWKIKYVTYDDGYGKYHPNDPVGVFGLNGWSNAALFGQGFEKLLASGKPLTRENLVAALNTLRDATVGGAHNVTFTPDDHRGTRGEAIIQAKGGSFELVRPFRPYPEVAFDAK